MQKGQGGVHGFDVHGDNLFALLAVAFLDRILDVRDGFVSRQHAGEREKADLHDRVDASAHAALPGNFETIDHVKLQLLRDELPLHRLRQFAEGFIRRNAVFIRTCPPGCAYFSTS
jgi:hypothetical protein